MIAARPIQNMTRGLGRNAFDLPVAALAGLAIAVIAFAIPADLLGRLVTATGLPHILAAADPPLGYKARGMIGIVGAGAAFGLVWLLMRMLDRASRGERAAPEPEIAYDEDMPRLRRRDLHPDAPVCRPISATRDFGEPAPPPLELTMKAEPFEPFEPAEAPEPAVAVEPAKAFAPAWFVEADEAGAEEAEAPQPEPVHTHAPEPEPEPELPPVTEASLPDLMRRLEQGLARRRTVQAFAPAPQQQPPAPQVFPEADDDRLQSAIESLQRFAARGE